MTDRFNELDETDAEFAANLARELDAAEHELSPEVLDALTQARREAVKVADGRSGNRRRNIWFGYGLGGVAAAVLVVALLAPQTQTLEQFPLLEDAEMAAAQDAELLEDLEFVAWMVAMEEGGAVEEGESLDATTI